MYDDEYCVVLCVEVIQLLQKGNKARTVEPTAMNKTSSRSHALLSVTVKLSVPLDSMTNLRMRVRQARLFMIDLAGSERANKTKNKGKRLQEGAHINRSLLALGNCINALSGRYHQCTFPLLQLFLSLLSHSLSSHY